MFIIQLILILLVSFYLMLLLFSFLEHLSLDSEPFNAGGVTALVIIPTSVLVILHHEQLKEVGAQVPWISCTGIEISEWSLEVMRGFGYLWRNLKIIVLECIVGF